MGLFRFNFPSDNLKMVRGPKKHMKRLAAPKSWMLDKLGGVYSCRPSSGPHRLSECMPISIFLRNRLKYALTQKEVESIMKQRLIKIDGKTRTDTRYPTGFMDVIQIDKTGKNSVSFMMLREDSPSTESPIRRQSISYAVSGQSRPDPRMFPSCTLLMAVPSVTPTQSSR